MTEWVLLRDGEPAGYLTDRAIAEHLDGKEIVTDGMYEQSTYTTVRVDELERGENG